MRTPRLFGYQQLHEGSVLITRQCRTVHVVRGQEQVSELLAALESEDTQTVLARYAARTARDLPAERTPVRS